MTGNELATATLPQDADERAVSRLKSSCGTSLTIHRSLSGDWILAPANDLTSAVLRNAVRDLDEDLRGGPKDMIAAAIMELLGATDRPPQLDEEKAAARVVALRNMAWDYPIEIVQAACRSWRKVPNYGRWWPTEQDLRAQCEPLFAPARSLRNKAMELLNNLQAEEEHLARQQTPSYFAGEQHRQFRTEMEKRLLLDQVRAYFMPTHIRYVGKDVIHVRTMVAEAIFRRYGSDVMRDLGMTVRFAPEDFLRERDMQRDISPEEDAEITRKMTRLNQAVKGGENIEALRRSGEI